MSVHFPTLGCVRGTLIAACVVGAWATEADAVNLIGLDFSTGAAAPIPPNWNRIAIGSGTRTDLIDDTGATTSVGINFGGTVGGATSSFLFLGTATLAADATPQHSYDLSGMTGYGFRASGEMFVAFTGLEPDAPYDFWFVAYRSTTAIQQNVTVSNGTVADNVAFTQSITGGNNGRFLVNTVNANNSLMWEDLALTATSSSTGTLRFDFAGDGQTTVLGALAIQLVPEPASASLLVATSLLLVRRRR